MAVATRLTKAPPATRGSALHPCAFCKGSGKDPFGLLSALALCGVCQGKGQVKLEEPVVECAFCSGTGIYPLGSRLTCTACGGKGMLTVSQPAITCQQCQGTGQDPQSGSDLYCLHCRGAGVVANREFRVSRQRVSSSRNPELKNGGEGVAQTFRSAKTKPGTYSRPYRKSPLPQHRRQG